MHHKKQKAGWEQQIRNLTLQLQAQVQELQEKQTVMNTKLQKLQQTYDQVIHSVQGIKQTMVAQDQLVQQIAQQINYGKARIDETPSNGCSHDNNAMIDTYGHIAQESERHLDQIANYLQGSVSAASSSPSSTNDRVVVIDTQTMTPRPRKRARSLLPGWSVPPRVLLVDDDSIFRRLSTRLLQLAGCTIDVAVDGLQAIEKLGTARYDIVLMV